MLSPHGRFGWHELMTSEPGAAARFYADLTGWRSEPFAGDPTYTLWMREGRGIAGLLELPADMRAAGVPPAWLTYVRVGNVPTATDKAVSMGGAVVVSPETIVDVGMYAVLRDPQGATFGVIEPVRDFGHDNPPAVGEFSWHELATTDPHAAWNFYNALFSWDAMDEFDMGPMGIYKLFGRGDVQLGGIYNKPAEMPMPPHWLPYIRVPNADDAAKTVRAAGGQIMNGPMEVPGGDRIAQCLDPQGAMFAVHTVAADVKPAPKPPAKSAVKKKPVKKAVKKKTVRRKKAR